MVVFPLPLGPTNANIVPGLTLKETLFRTKLFVSFSIFPSVANSKVSSPTSALVGYENETSLNSISRGP